MRLSPHAATEHSVLRVLTVCQTIHREALHLFYRHNALEFASAFALHEFLASLRPRRRAEITALALTDFGLHYTSYQCAAKAFSLLLLCPRLRSFRLDLSTEEGWGILAATPASARNQEVGWNMYCASLDCLMSLRGLTGASIRGIDPARWMPATQFSETELEEVRSRRADQLREAWTRPHLARTNVHNNPFTGFRRRIKGSCQY
ncbi:MAG: hypothetical protein Q9187_002998 [Circinaria calcarea]